MNPAHFWLHTPLSRLTEREWESLCDGCGRCCLHKVEDRRSGEVYYTRAACRLLDCERCRCRDYAHRSEQVPRCLRITPINLVTLRPWLPATCAYRLLAEGRDLYPWHPLISGDPESVHQAGISVRRLAIPEHLAGDPEMQIIPDWT